MGKPARGNGWMLPGDGIRFVYIESEGAPVELIEIS
jgi:hypothetical protein